MDTATFTIEDTDLSYGRLDKALLARFPSYSRNYLHFLFENQAVLKNGVPCKKRVTPRTGDGITISFLPLPEITAAPEPLELDVVYEDEHLVVLNKAPGMAVHPAPGSPSGTVVNALMHRYTGMFSAFDDPIRPGIVHRLDKDTTGLLLVAKSPRIQAALAAQFAARSVEKIYLGVTYGIPKEGCVDAPIGRSSADRKKMCIRDDGKTAQSLFRILGRNDPLSVVEITLLTGRTHQIRVHAKHLNAPLLGDQTYGIDHINKKFGYDRQLLHAWKLSFDHPVTNERLSLVAPPHKLMAKYLPV